MTSKAILKKERYFAQVESWRKKYGPPVSESIKGRDLTTVTSLRADRICAKKGCDRTKGLHRHHKGHDYLFACILPDVYAAIYIQYRNQDCVYLCSQHHKAIHRYYAPVVDEFLAEIANLRGKDIELCCEKYKKRLTVMCDNFVKRKARTYTNAQTKRKKVSGRKS